jgi:molybdopterin biosynthesis enzyme MoaB
MVAEEDLVLIHGGEGPAAGGVTREDLGPVFPGTVDEATVVVDV